MAISYIYIHIHIYIYIYIYINILFGYLDPYMSILLMNTYKQQSINSFVMRSLSYRNQLIDLLYKLID